MDEWYIIEKASPKDIDELEALYDDLIAFLKSGRNYPGWKKGVYPTRKTAETGVAEGTLYVMRIDGAIAGTVILNHRPESVYDLVKWGVDAEWSDVLVVHSLAVHPGYLKKGVAENLLDYAKGYAEETGMKALRLDVSIRNIPAIKLYEKCGYTCVDTFDFGSVYEYLNRRWYKVYEMIL